MKRLTAYPALREPLDQLQPKVFALSSNAVATPVQVNASELGVAADVAVERIKKSKFTSKGDKDKVISLYEEYALNTVGALTKTLGSLQMIASGSATAAPAEPLPQVDAPAASALRLAKGQPLLLLSWQGSGVGGGLRFGVVDATGGRVAAAVTGGDDVELAYDRCCQAVLPWRPPAAGWDAAFVGDARALRDLAEPAHRLADNARWVESATRKGVPRKGIRSALRAVGARAREIADGAARCQSIAHAAREAGGAVRSCVDAAMALFKTKKEGDRTQLQAALGKVREAVERLQPEAIITSVLRSSGALGARRYAAGQPLTVRTAAGWRDANVATAGADGLCHRITFLEGSGKPPATLTLHPWNHAPRELPHAAFEALSGWWMRELRKQHSQIFDVSGNPFDALQQCVAIEVMGNADLAGVRDVRDVHGLSDWLHSLHASQSLGEAITAPGAALLTAPPAAGKTTLISQAVVLALDRAELVPIVIKVQLLQARLRDAPDALASHWNWVDAYLRLTEGPALYRMLRQAMMARRALLLLDGLDEAGAKRAEIEQHVVEVLAPQGHVMLCTSRPAGVVEARFSGFRLLKLAPLTEAQQEQALLQRLGNEGDVRQLMTFVERMPTSTDPDAPTKQHRVTANPLVLSMVASVFEIRKGLGMPETVAELYASASDAMLARGGGVTAEVRTLLKAVFFEAHVAQARVITDMQLLRAALGAFAPAGTLADLDAKVVYPFQTFKGRPEKGHYVELLDGERKGQRGVIVKVNKTRNPYKVKLEDGAATWLEPEELASSGLDEAAFWAHMDAERLSALDAAVQALRDEELAAVAEVRERVGQDRLPLLSLLQVEPLQMQAAHLSFQEFFAAQAICSGKYRLPEGSPPPWQWPAFWANAVTLGSEMGDAFGKGLKQTARVGDVLDLSKKLFGGDRPTMVAVVAELMRVLASLSLQENKLTDGEGLKMFAALQTNTTLAQLDLGGNELGAESGKAMVKVLKTNTTLTQLNLNSNKLGDAGGCALAVALQTNTTLAQLDLGGNELGAESGNAITEALKTNTTLTQLNLNSNKLGDAGGCALAVALQTNTTLAQLDLGGNELGAESGKEMVKVLKTNATLRTVALDGDVLSIAELSSAASIDLSGKRLGDASGLVVAHLITHSRSLTQLSLKNNKLGDAGGCALAVALQTNTTLAQLDLGGNELGAESGNAIAEALKTNTTLTQLNLNSNKLGDAGGCALAVALQTNTTLAQLDLGGNELGVESGKEMVEALKTNVTLRSVALDGDILSIAVLSSAASIDLSGKRLGDASGLVVAHLITRNRSLTQLNLNSNKLGDAGGCALAVALQTNTTLAQLDLGGNELGADSGNAIAEALKTNTTLTQLNLNSNKLGDAGGCALAVALQTNTTLAQLDLGGNELGAESGNAMVKVLKTNTALTQLNLKNNKLGDAGGCALAVALQTNTTLAQLDLGGNKLGAESGKEMVEALKTNATLRSVALDGDILSIAVLSSVASIDLSGKRLGDASGLVVVHLITRNRSLTQLNLNSNKLGDAGGCALAVALQTNTTLAQLDLGGNKLGAESGKEMVKVLKTNATLRTVALDGDVLSIAELSSAASINLSRKRLGDASGMVIAHLITHNRSLTQLNLNSNKLGDAGGCALAVALQTNMTLAQLDLGGNELGAESGKAIAEALKTNTTLTQLNLNSNKLGDAGGCALAVALQTNTTLVQLDLGGNELGVESGKALGEALKTNSTAATLRTIALDGDVLYRENFVTNQAVLYRNIHL